MSSPAPPPPIAPPAGGVGHYIAPGGRHDEFKTTAGQIRPAWRRLADALEALPAGEMSRRADHLRRLIQENGITYNVYGEPGHSARPWGMDLLPMVLEWAEFEKIQAALRQRVQLLNLILQDLYGPQKLVQQRLLPPQLVLGNPAFLRPCHGFKPRGDSYLHIYGADLARSPDGHWWVQADRLDAPSGIGYALENRFLTTRVSSDWLQENRVARLTGFFQTLRDSLEALAARRGESPGIVLLTPGPATETYFEHSFLARNLGFPLVEGGDLAVRGQRAFLKTLSGMRPVDLILRRVDSDFCDPLELRNGSVLGVPGLVQAARAGQVTLANALGAGLLESPGFSPFLPALCHHLLDEELMMPSVATWWCGQPRELDYVLEHLDTLIIQPAFPRAQSGGLPGARLSAAERDHWRQRLRAEPGAWCARERIALATTPVFEDGRLTPRFFHFRSMLVEHNGEYHAMPGGLTRIPADPGDSSVSMQRGGRSKDTWVLLPPELPPTYEINPPPATVVKLRRQSDNVPSRLADNLYWLGRYIERTEGQARVLRLLAGVLAEEGAAAEPAALLPFFQSLFLADVSRLTVPGESGVLDFPAAIEAVFSLLWNPALPHSLEANAIRLESAAHGIKERLSADAWNLFGRFDRMRHRPERAKPSLDDALGRLTNLMALLAGVSGQIMENMTRGYGWRFLDLGRRLERGLNVVTLLRHGLAGSGAPVPSRLQNLLVGCDSLLTYRRRYLTNLHIVPVLDLLACDDANPRSLAFQLHAIREHVEALPRPRGDGTPGLPERLALALYSQGSLADAHKLAEEDAAGAHPALENFLNAVARDLFALSESLGQMYFAHGEVGEDRKFNHGKHGEKRRLKNDE